MKMDILQKLKRYRKKIWLFFLLTVFLCGACRAAYVTGARSGHVTIRELDSLQLEDCTKLMVVAHPDDETLWGGAHLLDGKYFVVCLTNGYNKVRRLEFLNAIKESGNKGLILRYPDKVRGERSKWVGDKKDIIKDLDTNNLYYFGKYYKKKVLLDIADSLPRISAKSESAKRELLLNYKSQKKVENMFAHMIPYEDWSQSGEIWAK